MRCFVVVVENEPSKELFETLSSRGNTIANGARKNGCVFWLQSKTKSNCFISCLSCLSRLSNKASQRLLGNKGSFLRHKRTNDNYIREFKYQWYLLYSEEACSQDKIWKIINVVHVSQRIICWLTQKLILMTNVSSIFANVIAQSQKIKCVIWCMRIWNIIYRIYLIFFKLQKAVICIKRQII